MRMNLLHKIFEKSLIISFAICFSFVSLYTPNMFHKPQVAEAAAVAGALEPTQILNNIELLAINAFDSITAAATPVTAAMTSNNWLKDVGLDGIAWSLAKSILSSMTSSIVKWVNSGFKGSPAFVQDISKHLVEVADKAFGEYLSELDGPYSFVCAPFKLDVRLALAVEYDQKRGKTGQSTASCSLTGVLANLEKFIDGTEDFTSAGGWDAWFKVTSNPTTYTPYGNLLSAQADASARLVNAKGEEVKLLEFGDGFLSSKICEVVHGPATSREDCFVSTPGKVINETLTASLKTGPDSLIAADEINEIISAVFSQLTQKAITGAAGLLGLSGGTGYTYSGIPFTEQITNSGFTSNPDKLLEYMNDSRNTELNYQVLAAFYEPLLRAYAADPSNRADRRDSALDAANTIPSLMITIANNIADLDALILRFTAMSPVVPETMQEISNDYFALSNLHNQVTVDSQESIWKNLIKP